MKLLRIKKRNGLYQIKIIPEMSYRLFLNKKALKFYNNCCTLLLTNDLISYEKEAILKILKECAHGKQIVRTEMQKS